MKPDFERQLKLGLEEQLRRGVTPAFAAPLPWRIFWRLGLAIPPPLYLSLAQLTGVFFGLFAVPVGGLSLFSRSLLLSLGVNLFCCFLLCLLLAALYFNEAAPYGDFDWKALPVPQTKISEREDTI